jgi:DNA invertase Pin-like site-specific DNA recombinase
VRAVVYTRQSQDRTGEGHAVERQEQDGRALAERRGWTVVKVIADNDLSASGRKPRPGFTRVVDLIIRREVDAVIAWDLTRLTRNARDTLALVEAGATAGTTLALVRGTDIDLSTPGGRLTADVLAAVAQHEIAQKSDRQRRAVRQAAEQGRRVGGRRPFGYEPNGIAVLEREAAALRTAYDAILAGASLSGTATALNTAGFTTTQGKPWTASTLRQNLINPRNCGLRAIRRRPAAGPARWEIIAPAVWPGIVAEQTWRAVGELLADPGRTTRGSGTTALLSGIGYCGWPGCTSRVHRGGTAGRAGGGGYGTYRCRDSGAHVTRKAEPIDTYVVDVVVARLSRPDAVDLLVDYDRPDVDQLRAKAHTLRRRRGSLARLLRDGTLDEDEVRVQAADLSVELAAVEADLTHSGRADVLRPLVEAIDVRAAWEALARDRQRAVIDAMVTVTLLPVGRGRRSFDTNSVRIEPKRRPKP